MVGGGVMVCDCVVVVLLWSLQPQKNPGVWQLVDVGDDTACELVVGSLHPNQPGDSQIADVSLGVLVAVG